MKHTADLVDLFVAAHRLGVDVVIHERRVMGARAALLGWAAVAQLRVQERDLGSLHRSFFVELPSGAEISVIVRKGAIATAGAAS